jgi:hypothetical protein
VKFFPVIFIRFYQTFIRLFSVKMLCSG